MDTPYDRPFDLRSEWWVGAPAEDVWRLLTHPEDWPGWWPYVRRVEPLSEGDEAGVGAVRRTLWGSRLPYGLDLVVRTVRVERPHRLDLEADGDLRGTGQWRLEAVAGGTRLRYGWRVSPARPWMRRLAPWLGPLFVWNHHQVMRAAARGMGQRLGVAQGAYRVLSAGGTALP